ncbi:ankyrin, partial [Lepidopterella palustris CBS 459.81]
LDAKLAKIRQWLSAPEPSMNYQKALKQRQADTGLWFLESKQYTKWKTGTISSLWLYGIPGCGKTVLSSTVLRNMLQHCHDDPGKVIAYFYFDFNDTQKQDPELMLRSLICQLSQQCVKIPTGLYTLCSSCENGQRQPSLDALLEVTQQMIREFPQSYIILDALDECADRAKLMGILEKIAEWQLQKLHLLVTSRRERDIESSLECFIDRQNAICLQTELVDKDIQRYVRQRLSDDKSLSKWQKDPTIRQEIETALMKGAHGMFRWAACQLDTLGKCRSRLTLRKSLATLPPTLNETYDRILSAIDKEDSEYAVRILRWLTFSSRPLLLEEISEIVAIDVKHDPVFNSEGVLEDPLEALDICSSLVTIATIEESGRRGRNYGSQSTRQVIVLAHYSVKEYLISERSRQGRAARYSMQEAICNEFIAKSCLGYLLQILQSESLSAKSIEEFKLAQYSAEFWMSHAQAAMEQTETLSRLAMKLFSTRNNAYINWIRIHDPEEPWKGPNFRKVPERVPAPLYYASRAGLIKVVSLLLENEIDVNAQGGEYGNALQVASYGGHEQVVKLLLDKSADVNAQGGEYGNALQVASYGGHEQIVKLLLDKGA